MLKAKFSRKRKEIRNSTGKKPAIWYAFHGSPSAEKIAEEGFDVSYSKGTNMFGKGIYFAPNSSKANQYSFGKNQGCTAHEDKACTICERQMLLCCFIMGKKYKPDGPTENIPNGYHSVVADPGKNELLRQHLRHLEVSVLHGDQVSAMLAEL
jgi:hypothetical protein